MKSISGGLRGAKEIKERQSSLRSLSSQLQMGTKYRLFLPIFRDDKGEPDMVIAAVPGRKSDSAKIKTSFIPLDDFEVTDAGKVVDNSPLKSYARIARVLHKAECVAEKRAAEDVAKREAETIGTSINQAALTKKLEEIETEYFGNNDVKPAVFASINPVIGGVVIQTATEVLAVPMSTDNKPDWSKKFYASLDLSSRKMSQLLSLLADSNFSSVNDDFLEVSYDYGRGETDKKVAGQNAVFQGVSKDMTLASLYPESWSANKDSLNNLSRTQEAICAKNYAFSSRVTVAEVIERLKSYYSKKKLALAAIDLEDDVTKSAAKDLIESGITEGVPKIQQALIEYVNTLDAENRADETEDNEGIDKQEFDSATKAQSITELASAGVDLDALAGGDPDMSASDIDNI